MITVTNLHKSFTSDGTNIPVLRGINAEIKSGETVAITGESGSGKSTLLHLIAGLDTADSGEISVFGTRLSPLGDKELAHLRRENFGIVFQQFNLISGLTVEANMAFQARLSGTYDAAWQAQLTDRLGLTQFAKRYPEQLSGGQQQRVAIGRAFAGKPKLILADEPTGNLDEETGDTVMELALELVASTQASLIMVTHSRRLATRLDRNLHLRNGQIA